jgi:hypothetical protein
LIGRRPAFTPYQAVFVKQKFSRSEGERRMARAWKAEGLFVLRQQTAPFAPQSVSNTAKRRDQNVQFAAFNLLDRSNVQI